MAADELHGGPSVLVAAAPVRARAELAVAFAVEGAVVADAASAREAYERIRRLRPSVAVIDLDPAFGGLPLLQVLHERDMAEGLRVVALSCPDDPAALAEAHLLGVERHLMVPAAVDEVVQIALEDAPAADGDRSPRPPGSPPAAIGPTTTPEV